MQRQHEIDRKDKQFLEEKVNSLQINIEELMNSYEQKLKRREDELYDRTERELGELRDLTDQIKRLELKLKESDNNYRILSQTNSTLQDELDKQVTRHRELGMNLGK